MNKFVDFCEWIHDVAWWNYSYVPAIVTLMCVIVWWCTMFGIVFIICALTALCPVFASIIIFVILPSVLWVKFYKGDSK